MYPSYFGEFLIEIFEFIRFPYFSTYIYSILAVDFIDFTALNFTQTFRV